MKTCPVCGKEWPDDTKFCPNDGSTLRSKNPTADLVGQIVADRYHIIKKLGEGGMGAVYLGEHVKMGRKSAIKVMAPSMANDPDAISRFNREAANASRISHANVCQIYDFGETPEGIIYLAMEFIEGKALTDVIEGAGALPAPRAASILKQAADGLQAAHDLGIVHRDIKPDNIMVIQGKDGSDIVKMVDFGIAKAVAGDETGQKVTKTGLVVGTPEYMSPEQLSGDKLDGRSDIYSLALVLYRMLTGVLPFQADSAQETMIKRLTDEPMPLDQARPDMGYPPRLQVVLDRALARTPGDRYSSAAQFGKDTMDAVAGLAMPETRVGAPVESLATQVMDADQVAQATRLQKAGKAGGGGAATKVASATPAPAAKKFPMMAAVVGGLVVVGGVGGGAAFLMRGKTPAQQLAATDSGRAPANAPATNPAPGTNTTAAPPAGSRTAAANPGNSRRPGNTAAAPGNTPAAPPATARPAVSIAESLNAVDRYIEQNNNGAAHDLAVWIYGNPQATPAQKANAAGAVATTFTDNQDSMIAWYRKQLRYDPNNARVLSLFQQLGVTP